MIEKPKISIFLVEDEELYAMMLDLKLQNSFANYQLTTFESGEECLKYLHYKPDVIILDYYLPGMNGMETLKQIKSSKEGKETPVIILSKQKDKDLHIDLLKEGAYEYIEKGKEAVSDLIKVINEIFFRNTLESLQRSKRKDAQLKKKLIKVAVFLSLIIIVMVAAYFSTK